MPPGPHAPPRVAVFDRPTAVRAHPRVPELPLHLIAGEVDLDAEFDRVYAAASVPFWPFVWAGGAALARHVLDHPELVRGLRVVDFGAGSGIVGLACARAGAAEITCVDLDPDALAACRANAALHGVDVACRLDVPGAWDVLLAADVLYLADNTAVLTELGRPGRVVVLCEAGRPGAPRPNTPPVATFDVATFPDVDVGRTETALHVFHGIEALRSAFADVPGLAAGSPGLSSIRSGTR